jgi:hypothetical protein
MSTAKRKNAEQAIKETAMKSGSSVEKVVQSILFNNRGRLNSYIIGQKEAPLSDTNQAIVQAALLRYAEIQQLAQTQNVTEARALELIEAREAEAGYTNLGDDILSPEVGAALKILLDQKKGTRLQNVGKMINKSKSFNGFTGTSPDPQPWLGSDWGSPTIAPTGTTGSTTAEAVGDWANTATSIFNLFNNVVDGINKTKTATTGAVNTVSDAVQTQLDKFGGVASDVGADSISKSLKDNLPTILLILGAVVIVIVIAIYATKRK